MQETVKDLGTNTQDHHAMILHAPWNPRPYKAPPSAVVRNLFYQTSSKLQIFPTPPHAAISEESFHQEERNGNSREYLM
jgi:hypothetical protein